MADAKDSEQTIATLSKELDGLRQEICEKKEDNQKFEQEKNDLLAELEDTIDQVNLLKRELESQKQNYDQLWKICEQKDTELKSRENELSRLKEGLAAA